MNIQNSFFGIALLATASMAQVPGTVLFQGTMSKSGTPLTGSHDVVINLCTSSVVNTDDCQEIYVNDNVAFTKGYYSVLLGTDIPLPSFDQQYYLQVSVDGSTPDARIELSSTTSALNALRADTAKIALKANAVATDVAVTSVNGLKNAVSIAAGTGISITKSGSTITVNGPDVSTINNNSVTTKSAKISSYAPGQGGISICDATTSGTILNLNNVLSVCSKALGDGTYSWRYLGLGGDNVNAVFRTTTLTSYTPGMGGIGSCDETRSGEISNISNRLTACTKDNYGNYYFGLIAIEGGNSTPEFHSVRPIPFTPGQGGVGACDETTEGTIKYTTGASSGGFIACVKTAANTYDWKGLTVH